MAVSDELKTRICPDCAEELKAAARVCRFCGYRFSELGGVRADEEPRYGSSGTSETRLEATPQADSECAPEDRSNPLGAGAVPGSLAGHFSDALGSARTRRKHLDEVRNQAPRGFASYHRYLLRHSALMSGMTDGLLNTLEKRLGRPDRREPPEMPPGTMLVQLVWQATVCVGYSRMMVSKFTGQPYEIIDHPVSDTEFGRTLTWAKMTAATDQQLQRISDTLPQLRPALDQAHDQAGVLGSAQLPFVLEHKDRDGTLLAMSETSLRAIHGRAAKWVSTAEFACRNPDQFQASPASGERDRSFELCFLAVDGVLDRVENMLTVANVLHRLSKA